MVTFTLPNAEHSQSGSDGGSLFADSRPFRFHSLHLEPRIADFKKNSLAHASKK